MCGVVEQNGRLFETHYRKPQTRSSGERSCTLEMWPPIWEEC